jgi:hypothetical protein
MPDADSQLWPRPRRRRWERFLDAIANALELMGRYQIDSPLADYYQPYYDDPGPQLQTWGAAHDDPGPPPHRSPRVVLSRTAPRERLRK